MPERDYDVVLYGATGFVGRLTVGYFAERAPRDLVRWAIAGRDRPKLEAVKAMAGEGARNADVLVADGHDQEALDAIVSRTRIILSTTGPFALYGDRLVDACVRFRTHYADITGETAWVRRLVERHHDRAAADGTRIIPFCGFDSVPSDLGAYLVVRHAQRHLGVPCGEVKAYFQMQGGFNGGTLATVLHTHDSGQARALGDPYLLNPPGARSPQDVSRAQDVSAIRYDPDIGAWTGPFFMAPVNTRVVRRSAALYGQWHAPYGPDFSYQEYLKYDPPLARLKAYAVTSGVGLFQAGLHRRATRRVLKALLPRPGTGPSERTMAEGWFSCALLGRAADGRRVHGVIRHQGDPSNRATVQFVCESALGLCLNAEALPGGAARGGVLTPATALGDVLADRLREAGTRIAVGS